MTIISHKNNTDTGRYIKNVFYVVIFVSMFIFFYVAHPFILYDTDDWFLISKMRMPLPLWGSFNPAKVFPETFMPLCGLLGSMLFYPLTHDYLLSIALICAIAASLFITAYVIQFDKFITEKFRLNTVKSCCITVLFLSAHFLIFKKEMYNNVYLLGSKNVCCYFNYTIPALLNAALVLFFMRKSLRGEAPRSYLNGWLIVLIYLAVCSNLYSNIILSMYAFYEMMLDLFHTVRSKRFHLQTFLKQHIFYESILISWLLCLLFEFFGQRSGQIHRAMDLKKAFLMFAGRLYDFNYGLLTFFIILSFLALYLLIKKKADASFLETEAALVISCFLVMVYLILLSAKVSPAYMRRSDIIFAVFFYVFLGAFICLGTVLSKLPRINYLLPFACFVLLLMTCNTDAAFCDTNAYSLSWEKCYRISGDLLEQILEADKNDLTKITLHVPLGSESEANWPHATYLGEVMSAALVRHGIISAPMEITIVPDAAVNEKYRIP